jgi:hypothetical protein
MRDTIDMAREAGFTDLDLGMGRAAILKAFEALVRADERSVEREACAKVCDRQKLPEQLVHNNAVMACRNAIRARGNT